MTEQTSIPAYTRPSPTRRSAVSTAARTPLIVFAIVADVFGVLMFCVIGRRSHAEGLAMSGVAETAWPFLVGAAVGWLVIRGWRNPIAVVPTGLVVWACTVVVGMLLRLVTSAGVAVSFVVVASIAIALLLVGWRMALDGLRRLPDQS